MNSLERKKVTVMTKYALESFSESDWYTLGQITGKLKVITDHPRLFRAMGFGDGDYEHCVAEILDTIFTQDASLIPDVIDHFDIDLWYQQKDSEKYRRIFSEPLAAPADFWTEGYLKMFVSHLSSNKERMSALKAFLANWGISAFVAHEDIQASREWRNEVEAGLETMEVMIAVVEPEFKKSDWCPQEVGFALGRKIDIIPLRAGMDPFGFFGKFQGIQIKGKIPEVVSNEITELLLKKPKHRERLLQSMGKAFAKLQSEQKIKMIELLESWSIATDDQIKTLLEASSLSEYERKHLKNLAARVGAFKAPVQSIAVSATDDDIPF
jgi:hypothetical protein